MFRLSVLQYQWLILALFGGAVLVLTMVLTYMMMWRPRKENQEAAAEAVAESDYQGYSALRWYSSFMPWILTLTFVSVVVFAIIYAFYSIKNPPNW